MHACIIILPSPNRWARYNLQQQSFFFSMNNQAGSLLLQPQVFYVAAPPVEASSFANGGVFAAKLSAKLKTHTQRMR
jgi:hypothetical protein